MTVLRFGVVMAMAVMWLGVTALAQPAWRSEGGVSPMTDQPVYVLALAAQTPVRSRDRDVTPELWITCQDGVTNLFVDYQTFVSTQAVKVQTRADQDAAVSASWGVSTDFEAVGLWSDKSAIPFLRTLLSKDQFRVSFTPYGESPVLLQFDLQDLATQILPLAEACNWLP